MIYQVSYYGMLAERRGLASEALESACTTPRALYQEIDARHPLGLAQGDLRAAVNDEFVCWDHPLVEGDHLAFLPPMSGG